MITPQTLIFLIVSGILLVICRHQLLNPRCHGFYRFFAFEGILALALLNIQFDDRDLLSPMRLISGALMLSSLAVVIISLRQLKQAGQAKRQDAPENFTFENTLQLITDGVYGYVRHPMYTSLLLLGWGLFFQDPSLLSAAIATEVSLFLICTILAEEKENRQFFGENYLRYQQSNKMLIPFLL
ncbi:methyltransferase family protein [Pseudomaricurvus sp.]|uniref:methyltransferase family protein n=1 Tax=Pseudomaricurvus sp. TaxID=2004510 RepID=UPI003F6B4B53